MRTHRKVPIDRYLDFFDASVQDTVNGQAYGDGVHDTTQNGIVTWTSKEKDVVFNALARKGSNAISQIAAIIGSKCEMEVRDYLDLLQRGLVHQHLFERHSRTVTLRDIPAAFEISEECCQALEGVAEAISLKEEQTQNTIGRKRHGNMWCINRQVAEAIEREVASAEDEVETKFSIFSTAKLLDIGNWIELSERIFMNAGKRQSEDNWTNLTFKNETPSMTCEAFSDFYVLAVSITRRLVQSSIFFAMSRLRATEQGGCPGGNFVRRDDVNTVLHVLKMKPDSKVFWAGVARRCHLDVDDIQNRKDWQRAPLTYDEVEEQLTSETPYPKISRRDCRPGSPLFSNESMEYSGSSDNGAGSVASNSSPSVTTDGNLSDPEELQASIIDQRASHAEELRLWGLLRPPSPSSLSSSPMPDVKIESGGDHHDSDDDGDNDKAHNRRIGERKTKQDLVDWRDRTLYRNEWEEFGPDTSAVEKELMGNRRKRRRLYYE